MKTAGLASREAPAGGPANALCVSVNVFVKSITRREGRVIEYFQNFKVFPTIRRAGRVDVWVTVDTD